MLKRMLFIGLCLCLVALMTTDADARCRVVDGKWKCSDLCPVTEGTGAGNTERDPITVCVSYFIADANGTNCWNPAWNSGTTASDVFLEPEVAGIANLTSGDITDQKGNFYVEFEEDADQCISWDQELWPALNDSACPNAGWHYVYLEFDPEKVHEFCVENTQTIDGGWWCPALITTMYSYHATYQEKKGELIPASGLFIKCEQYDSTKHNYEDVQCNAYGNELVCGPADDIPQNIASGLISACDNSVGAVY